VNKHVVLKVTGHVIAKRQQHGTNPVYSFVYRSAIVVPHERLTLRS